MICILHIQQCTKLARPSNIWRGQPRLEELRQPCIHTMQEALSAARSQDEAQLISSQPQYLYRSASALLSDPHLHDPSRMRNQGAVQLRSRQSLS